MLRASAHATGVPVVVRGVVDAAVDLRVPAGDALRTLADAVTRRDEAMLQAARRGLAAEVGPRGTVTAIAVAANFQMMNRILDATGVPISKRRRDLAAELGVPGPLTRRSSRPW